MVEIDRKEATARTGTIGNRERSTRSFDDRNLKRIDERSEEL